MSDEAGEEQGPPPLPAGPPGSAGEAAGDEAAVRAANEAFYAAFEARDLAAMDAVWDHSDRVWCTHPGWPRLVGWEAVRGSWEALFDGPQQLQFVLTAVEVEVRATSVGCTWTRTFSTVPARARSQR